MKHGHSQVVGRGFLSESPMFRKHNDQEIYVDLSSALRDRQDWAMGALRTFQYLSDISSFAYEPVSGLLAVGEPFEIFVDLHKTVEMYKAQVVVWSPSLAHQEYNARSP